MSATDSEAAVRPSLTTVILNTNRREDTLECLDSLAACTYPNHHVIVLDNASEDGSVEATRAAHPAVEIIELRENKGYAGNNNVGIAAALGRGSNWIFVLNEDTIVAPDCLHMLIAAGEADPRCGVVGPMVYHHEFPDVIQSAGGMLGPAWDSIHLGMDEADRGEYREPRPVEWISGCGMLVRRAAVEQVGLLDDRFFYYWEETEWCIRLKRAGWQTLHVPQAKIWHKGVTVDHKPKPSVTYYNTRNRLLMLVKHRAPVRVQLLAWSQMLRTLGSWSVKSKWRHMRAHRNALWRGIVDFACRRWGPMPS